MKILPVLLILFVNTVAGSYVCPGQNIVWTVAGSPSGASGFSGDGGPATAGQLSAGEGIWLDASGNVYFSDMGNQRIRKVSALTGIITTIAGTGTPGFSRDGFPATSAQINSPYGLGADAAGNVYFADESNNRVRRIDAASGIITTVAGTGVSGYSGDGGPATNAQIAGPQNVYADNRTGDLLIAAGGRIRKISSGTGIISTVAGRSTGGFSGDGGPAVSAEISNLAAGIVTDRFDNIYIADRGNNRVRKINAATGIISTVAGTGSGSYSGDGLPATIAAINGPIGIAIDPAGNLIISDNQNDRVRVVDALTGIIRTIGGTGSSTLDGIPALSAFIHPEFICLGNGGCGADLYLSNWILHNQIRKITNVGSGGGATLIIGDTVVCTGNTLALGSSNPGGAWSSSNTGVATVGSATGVVTGISPGTATISYSGGCADTATVITVKPGPSAITGPDNLCIGGISALTDASSGGVWTCSNTTIAVIGSASGAVTGISSGAVVITYSIGTNCFVVKSVTVVPLPNAGTITGNHLNAFCVGSSFTISDTASGGVWSTSNSHATLSGDTLTAVSGGWDTVYYSVTNSCGTAVDSFPFVVSPLLPKLGDSVLCVGSKTVINKGVLLGAMFFSSNALVAGLDFSSLTDVDLVGVSTGTATISYTQDLGCPGFTTVTVLASPDPGIISGPPAICPGTTFKFAETVAGGVWSSSNSLIASIDSITGIISSHASGATNIIYTTLPNLNGCRGSDSFAVDISPLVISGTVLQPACNGDNTGTIVVSAGGGTGPYQYIWTPGNTSPALDNLTPGTYKLTVKDLATQCTITDSFTITEPDSLFIIANTKNETCNLGNGSISIDVTGGKPPYKYLWSDQEATKSISHLSAGVYSFTLTDSNNCIKNLSVKVGEDTCLSIIVHDIITPNGDGLNDTWVIEGLQDYPKNKVRIFDKWGNEVFSRDGYNNDWQGRGGNGEQLPDGTYFYVVKLNTTSANGSRDIFTGSILIKR